MTTTRTSLPPSLRPLPYALSGTEPDITLPADFRAFHAIHRRAYLAYADAHTPTGGDDLVRGAFGHLAVHWSTLLTSPNPTATAWDHAAAHIARRTPRLPLRTASPLHYQLTVLHQLANLSVTTAADTTGCDHATARCLLRVSGNNPLPVGRR
ncbi:hypothetical protein [Streptomyces niveus]|uniref:hypothetical protein n=1 Tax=Streptomyces niveus TaxID=193462 RepID=UPI0003C62713|nr:hypothetical protein [Streptomyces niveus]EST18202.1 hypothetical protein M877_39275 [Streptomyces niveus NCIMB 11891]